MIAHWAFVLLCFSFVIVPRCPLCLKAPSFENSPHIPKGQLSFLYFRHVVIGQWEPQSSGQRAGGSPGWLIREAAWKAFQLELKRRDDSMIWSQRQSLGPRGSQPESMESRQPRMRGKAGRKPGEGQRDQRGRERLSLLGFKFLNLDISRASLTLLLSVIDCVSLWIFPLCFSYSDDLAFFAFIIYKLVRLHQRDFWNGTQHSSDSRDLINTC